MIKSDSYSKIYHQLLKDVYNNPEFEVFGDFKECLNVSFTLSNIMNNEVINHYKAPNYKYAKEYFKHIISGNTNVNKLAEINPIVKKFTDSTGLPTNFTSQYGPRIKSQLPRVIKLLKEDTHTRRAVINILDKDDKIIWDIETTHEYPCTNIIHFFIRKNKLHCLVQMRSNNMVNTITYDVYIFTNLMKYVYNKLKKIEEIGYKGLQWGNYHHQISSAHIFNRDNKLVELILKGEANE